MTAQRVLFTQLPVTFVFPYLLLIQVPHSPSGHPHLLCVAAPLGCIIGFVRSAACRSRRAIRCFWMLRQRQRLTCCSPCVCPALRAQVIVGSVACAVVAAWGPARTLVSKTVATVFRTVI